MTFGPLADAAKHPNGWPMRLLVCGQAEIRRHGAEWGVSDVISIAGPGSRYDGLAGLPTARHLRLGFSDVVRPSDPAAPTMAMLDAVCTFVDSLPPDALLGIHCVHGVSRSTAIALGLLARALPVEVAAATLHRIRPYATPNDLVVALWDRRLDLGGALKRIAQRFPTREWVTQ